jgi:glycosyltransferase involved in cell wall biosynthesis
MSKISIVIHTYNNEKIIKECLEGVKDFDEIVICDMYSTDKTLEIAREYGCKIVMHDNIGWADPARNFAIQQASCDWVLVVDSDEVITKELKIYLYKFIKDPKNVKALKIPRKNLFWGVEMKMQYPDYITRFFKKDSVFWPPYVHSHPEVSGEIYTIPKKKKELAFIHYTVDSVGKFVNVINKYTDFEVEKLAKAGKKRPNMFIAAWKSLFLVFEKFFFKKGWQNGTDGFILCCLWGIYKFLMYAKYREFLIKEGQNA